MDDIIKSLENIEIKESHIVQLTVSQALSSCVNFQKCYIPPKLFWSLDILPGDPVSLHRQNTMFILRAFPSSSDNNKVDIHGIVECPIKHHTRAPQGFLKIQPKKLSSIEIDIVCNNMFLSMWLSQKSSILPILERRILKNILLCVGSTVHYNTVPDTLTWGVRKIIVVQANTMDVGFIGARTKITLRKVFTELQYQNQRKSLFTHSFGVDRVIKQFSEIISTNIHYRKLSRKFLPPIKQVLLAGPSGCGKSSLVQMLSERQGCPLVRVQGPDASHKELGQAEQGLRNLFLEAFAYASNNDICIILLEDVDILSPSGNNITPHSLRLSTQLMQLLDECQETTGIIVIATTNKPSDISASLRRHGRLAKEIFMGKPTENERTEIISNFMDLFGNFTNFESSLISKEVANITPGFLGADLKFLCQMACFKMSTMMTGKDIVNSCIKIMKEVLRGMKPASLRNDIEIVPGGTPAQAIGGLDKVKKQLDLSVYCSLLQPHIYTRLGIQKPRGILLYGPPGCAKTSLVKTLAAVGNITVLCASSASIYSPYVGDAEKAIVNLFQSARQNAPAVIFFDEIDSLVGSRSFSNDSNNVQERVLAALLTQMDGIGIAKEVDDHTKDYTDGDDVMVIAATNRPNEIDPALLRPGRFDRHMYVAPPDAASRLQILSIVTQNTPLDKDVDLEQIAQRTEFYSGADLKNLHMETVLRAMQEDGVDVGKITKTHYDAVLKVIKPSLHKGIDEKFRNVF